MYKELIPYIPALGVLAGSFVVLWISNWLLMRHQDQLGAEAKLPRQLLMFMLSAIELLIVLLLLPIPDTTRNQLIGLMGIFLTGIIALSSTTFVSNAMAGLMLRIVNSFRVGDFVQIGDQFGRVTERGLFHTEIQTEDRDLTTLPNLHLVVNPVKVVHSKGTLISSNVSLGYDILHTRLEKLLNEAAEAADLKDSFVLITALNDFSVSYRVAGFLPEVEQLLSAKSNLNKKILDVLHANDIEIVSPTFMNQRALTEGQRMIPAIEPSTSNAAKTPMDKTESAPQDIIFDVAEEAAEIETLREHREQLLSKLEELKQQLKSTEAGNKPAIEQQIEAVEANIEKLTGMIKTAKGKNSQT